MPFRDPIAWRACLSASWPRQTCTTTPSERMERCRLFGLSCTCRHNPDRGPQAPTALPARSLARAVSLAPGVYSQPAACWRARGGERGGQRSVTVGAKRRRPGERSPREGCASATSSPSLPLGPVRAGSPAGSRFVTAIGVTSMFTFRRDRSTFALAASESSPGDPAGIPGQDPPKPTRGAPGGRNALPRRD